MLAPQLCRRQPTSESGYRTILDMDSTEVPVYGEQEQSAYNGYFESTCFHPLLASHVFSFRLRTLPCGQGQRLDPSDHGPEESPRKMALGQQQPVIPTVLQQPTARLHQPLLQARQRPV